MKRWTEQPAEPLFAAAEAAMRSAINDSSLTELSPEAISIGMAAAVLAISPIGARDLDGYIEHLLDLVRHVRACHGMGAPPS
jgi:hypothetical protein